jgi:hypothetical protein
VLAHFFHDELYHAGGDMKIPENKFGTYNVVILYMDGYPYILTGNNPHHAMLTNALSEHEIPYELMHKTFFPKAAGPRYQTLGMGYVQLDNTKKTAVFGGYEFSYEMGINKRHTGIIQQFNPEWEITIM